MEDCYKWGFWGFWATVVCGIVLLKTIVKNVNWWLYESQLGDKQYTLPPGDLGWPFIGNMWSFLRAFKSSHPDSFLASFVNRYGRTGMYKALMFGSPSVIVATPETCRKVLTDDETFILGWPQSTIKLIGRKSFIAISTEEHRRLRRLTSASINGFDALSLYLTFIEDRVKESLEKWTTMGQFEFLSELRKLTFKIIMHIFLSAASESVMEALEKEYTALNHGVRAMGINLPGFAYHKALKARKNLVAIMQSVVDERKKLRKENPDKGTRDMLDGLMDIEDENGGKLGDEDIIDLMMMYLNAGHESSGHITMWTTVYLQRHPEYLQKAREEQLEILRKRPPTQKNMTLQEFRQMEYLSNVIDETLRLVTFSLVVFRQATKDVKMNGYTIPKGWKVLVWFRNVHHDPEIYPNPKEFNPNRWNNVTRKAGEFLPFGTGSRLCPGNDLAKLEVAVFLHHFLLNYELELANPKCPVRYLPHTRPTDNCLGRIKKRSSTSG